MAVLSQNKKVYFDYHILETFQAGLVLQGQEVKSIKKGRINLAGAYVVARGGELYLVGATVPAYQPKNAPADYDSSRARKLLLQKTEIKYLLGKLSQRGLTLLPLKVYNASGLVKIAIGLGRGKRQTDKRERIKKRELDREVQRVMKEQY